MFQIAVLAVVASQTVSVAPATVRFNHLHGAGRWKLVARMRCESGQDGSANFIKGSRTIRIRN